MIKNSFKYLLQKKFRCKPIQFSHLAVSHNLKVVYYNEKPKVLCINWKKQKLIKSIFMIKNMDNSSMKISPSDSILATGNRKGNIHLWRMSSAREMACLQNNNNETIWCTAFSPDEKTLASGSSDMKICIWSLETFQLRK